MEVDCTCGTSLFTETTNVIFTVCKTFHMKTISCIDVCNFWNSLSERNIDCLAVIQVQVESVWNFLVWTFFDTSTTTCTFCFINITWMAFDIDFEVTDITADTTNFTVRKDADVRVLADFCHFWSYDTRSTVKCRECFVQHGHFTADSNILFYDINRESCISNVQSSCNTCNTTTDNKSTLSHWSFTRSKRCIKDSFCNGSLTKGNCFFCSVTHIFHNP